jgi:hypothetical protein
MASLPRNMHWCAAVTAFCSFSVITVAPSFAQSANQPLIQSSQATLSPRMVQERLQVNSEAVLARAGDAKAIALLSETVFTRMGVPSEVANALFLTQRVAQAETDYRAGAHPAVHEADLVKAHNNFANALALPEWAHTNQAEVRRLRMQLMARYPQLLASQAPPDANGKFEALNPNISPIEATFLATSLLFQKTHSPAYQLTPAEQAAGGKDSVSTTVLQQRMALMYFTLHGRSESVDLVDLNRATSGLLSDLGISETLRPEFQKLNIANAPIAAKGGR